jgi:thiol-disulfide isomerase/thioredoxin
VNPRAEPSRETVRGSVRHVVAADPPELLIPDTSFPDGPVRLLWLGGRAASPLVDGRTAVTDGAGGVLVFDAALRLRRAALQPGHREIVAVAGDINGGLWLTDAAGAVLRASPDGAIREVGVEAFDYPVVASDPTQPGAWLARLHRQWEYRLPTGTAPLLVGLDENGAPVRRVGRAVVPKAVLLSELASAGHVAVLGDRVYFAPFIRDQLIAFSSSGDTLWLAERGLPQSTAEPDFEVKDGSPAIDYHPVNIGLAVGPDRRLYLLSTPGFTTEEARLDVYHPASGDLLRTTPLGSALPTLAAGDDGRVYLLDEFRLLAGIAPDERDAFPPLSGDLLGGGTVSSAVLEGRVTLVNFWASWCDPCRTEMPALDSLSKSIADARWQFLTVNEDVHAADARAFVDEFRFTFPVVLGRGRLRSRYHYVGLPFTVLVDGQGRVVQRWIGFAGPEQIQGIRAVVTAELGRMGEGAGDAVHAH